MPVVTTMHLTSIPNNFSWSLADMAEQTMHSGFLLPSLLEINFLTGTRVTLLQWLTIRWKIHCKHAVWLTLIVLLLLSWLRLLCCFAMVSFSSLLHGQPLPHASGSCGKILIGTHSCFSSWHLTLHVLSFISNLLSHPCQFHLEDHFPSCVGPPSHGISTGLHIWRPLPTS